MVLDSIQSQEITSLLLVFELYHRENAESFGALQKLVKNHRKAKMNSNLIESVISSAYFVELIPDFLDVINHPDEDLLIKSFESVFKFSETRHFSKFCLSCVENFGSIVFHRILEILLKKENGI
jgi:hypothetical protein